MRSVKWFMSALIHGELVYVVFAMIYYIVISIIFKLVLTSSKVHGFIVDKLKIGVLWLFRLLLTSVFIFLAAISKAFIENNIISMVVIAALGVACVFMMNKANELPLNEIAKKEKKKKIKILYYHGFGSHANGYSSKLIRGYLTKCGLDVIVDAPENPYMEPSKSIDVITNANDYDFIIASSLGAFFALQNKTAKKILVNPAIPDDLLKCDSKLSKEYIASLNALKDEVLSNITDFEKSNTYFVYGSKDSLAQNKELYTSYFGNKNAVVVDMEHKLDLEGAKAIYEIIKNNI